MKETINVYKEFSEFPFGRYTSDGDFSGERFRKEYLVPKLNADLVLHIDLSELKDDVGSSFYEESFGGLIRDEGFDKDFILQHIIISAYKPDIEEEIRSYIEEARTAS